jgi:uncharacterized protein (TIRG00374 family)
MTDKTKKWLKFALRWTIAAAGITFVLWKIEFHDRVTVLHRADGRPVSVRVLGEPRDADATFRILLPLPTRDGGQLEERVVPRGDLWVEPDVGKSRLLTDPQTGQPTPNGPKYRILAALAGKLAPRAVGASEGRREAQRLLVEHPDTEALSAVGPEAVADKDARFVSSPLVDVGLIRLVRNARWKFLVAALALLPISFLLTSYRWKILLDALEIHIGATRTFVINMVGAFYNSFMPGSTGGDLVKAYYVAKHTDLRTRAVLSVLVDRVIGLVALIILGGTMAALQFHLRECARVAVASAVLLGVVAVGLLVFYHPTLHRLTGLDFILKRLPMQRQVHKAVEAMHMYGRRPKEPLKALLLSFPVHITTILSATLAGMAFDLPLGVLYYWVVVPVIALSGAIPISPQGAGVMEFTAIALTEPRGATPGQAVALAMSIRLGQIFWNLVAGLFVLRGGYHAPTQKEQHEFEEQVEHEQSSEFGVQSSGAESAGAPDNGEVTDGAVHAGGRSEGVQQALRTPHRSV